ncbi:MAG: Hsp33 family molecular chaperone HslO [Acidobacteria bacterium]|jgi:molecular chaperone Hsp33|nr:Hsp33 family molecular chaperone HslO [Acidobacteriota bacterium]
MDKLINGTAADGTIRFMAAITTEITTEAMRRHQTSPTVSAALGRVMTGTLMLGASLKEFDRLTVKIECEGAVKGITAEATTDSKVRGYVKNPHIELPPKDNGKFDVSGIIGKGMFYVIRESGFDIGLHREPYVGSVPIVSGEIAEDFAYYLAKSEQIPSAVLLGVLLQNAEPFVKASGGVMIQIMPGANQHIITMIEDAIAHAPHITSVISEGANAEDLVKLALGEIDFSILEERQIKFECNCSFERAVLLISSLGREEVASMLKEDKGAQMTCGFCSEIYTLDEADLQKMLETRAN